MSIQRFDHNRHYFLLLPVGCIHNLGFLLFLLRQLDDDLLLFRLFHVFCSWLHHRLFFIDFAKLVFFENHEGAEPVAAADSEQVAIAKGQVGEARVMDVPDYCNGHQSLSIIYQDLVLCKRGIQ